MESVDVLEKEINKLKEDNSAKLQGEYQRLVDGLRDAQQRRETEQVLANPVLPEHILNEAVPGSIRKGEHFVAFLKRLIEYVKVSIELLSYFYVRGYIYIR